MKEVTWTGAKEFYIRTTCPFLRSRANEDLNFPSFCELIVSFCVLSQRRNCGPSTSPANPYVFSLNPLPYKSSCTCTFVQS